ncbi:hypothetical protein SmJEL517_g03581 [Synchytrium microbalum]|uniref:SH3 domain-containing protein n=1 Tax=Synchytrium microbalum TaxID=1806994 RepID=A0A507C6B5_9FUNG|nr:uncharacterized protein SmJEL517_g03581 [Synchytrium microbalum]TPX33604.1 hypothetical protein SmJEL517_g03581 [Synchytrium microbalum]
MEKEAVIPRPPDAPRSDSSRTMSSPPPSGENHAGAFSVLDSASFGMQHMLTIVVAGLGFFADSYDLFIINLLIPILGYVYFGQPTLPSTGNSILTASAQAGAILGQISFGVLSDIFGRKRLYGIELMVVIIGTVGSAMCAPTVSGMSIIAMLSLWRLVVGFGVGGDYPMAACISSEFATVKRRGLMMGLVFSMQGLGTLTGILVSLVTLAIWRNEIQGGNIAAFDHVWRIAVVFCVVPCVATLYFRLTIPESPRYTLEVAGDVEGATRDAQRFLSTTTVNGTNGVVLVIDEKEHRPAKPVAGHIHNWDNFKEFWCSKVNVYTLIGTAGPWFLIDIAIYGLGLNNTLILNAIGFGASTDPWQNVQNLTVGNLIIALLGNIPGYFLGATFLDRIGRRNLQMIGFGGQVVMYTILATAYDKILKTSVALFMVLYAIAQIFNNFGANLTTFIIAAEAFPTRYRSTGHGISAACGKVGALIASYGFSQVQKAIGLGSTLGILAGFMFLGFITTYYFTPETGNAGLENLNEKLMATPILNPDNDKIFGPMRRRIVTKRIVSSERRLLFRQALGNLGFFADSYDLFIINVLIQIGYVYFNQAALISPGNSILASGSSMLASSAQTGAILGQLTFGVLSDMFGRTRLYGLELTIVIIETIGSALCAPMISRMNFIAMLSLWRGVAGFGVRGDYSMIFNNFEANLTTFIIAAEAFPTSTAQQATELVVPAAYGKNSVVIKPELYTDIQSFDLYVREHYDNCTNYSSVFSQSYDCPGYKGQGQRYHISTFCSLLVERSTILGCGAPVQQLCVSTCQAAVKSLTSLFDSPNICTQNSQLAAISRSETLRVYNSLCMNLTATSQTGCIVNEPSVLENVNCGFFSGAERMTYCATNPNDMCCQGAGNGGGVPVPSVATMRPSPTAVGTGVSGNPPSPASIVPKTRPTNNAVPPQQTRAAPAIATAATAAAASASFLSKNSTILIALLILIILAAVIGFFLYRRHQANQASQIGVDNANLPPDAKDGDDSANQLNNSGQPGGSGGLLGWLFPQRLTTRNAEGLDDDDTAVEQAIHREESTKKTGVRFGALLAFMRPKPKPVEIEGGYGSRDEDMQSVHELPGGSGSNNRQSMASSSKSGGIFNRLFAKSAKRHEAVANYFPTADDEIEVLIKDKIEVKTNFDDGWAMGRNLRTKKEGIFPMACLGMDELGLPIHPSLLTASGEEPVFVDTMQRSSSVPSEFRSKPPEGDADTIRPSA